MDERFATLVIPIKIMGAGELTNEQVRQILKSQHMPKLLFPLIKNARNEGIHIIGDMKKVQFKED